MYNIPKNWKNKNKDVNVIEPKIIIKFKADAEIHYYDELEHIAMTIDKMGRKPSHYKHSVEIEASHVILDFNEKDELIGIEILSDNCEGVLK